MVEEMRKDIARSRYEKDGYFQGFSYMDNLGIPSLVLSGKTFTRSPEITVIRAHDNDIISFDENLFEKNNNLKELSLHTNRISSIPVCLFKNCVKLSYLNLSVNCITSIPENLFESCRESLVYLNLEGNDITSLPEKLLKDCSALRNLNLSNNRLTSIPEEFLFDTVSLETLFLSNNNFSKLPDNIFSRTVKLKMLVLNNCKLQTLPYFRNCVNLDYLQFDNNLISSLRTELFESCRNIRNFIFWNNNVSSIPFEILYLQKVYIFHFFRNPVDMFRLHPIIKRFLYRGSKKADEVNDKEEDIVVEKAVIELLKEEKNEDYSLLLTASSKKKISKWILSTAVHPVYYATFDELFGCVCSWILKHPRKDFLKGLLNRIIMESKEKEDSSCFDIIFNVMKRQCETLQEEEESIILEQEDSKKKTSDGSSSYMCLKELVESLDKGEEQDLIPHSFTKILQWFRELERKNGEAIKEEKYESEVSSEKFVSLSQVVC